MSDVIVGVDAGTSVIKAVAFTTDGDEIAVASRPNTYATLPDGGVEQDMARTWTDTVAVLSELAERDGTIAPRTVAIAVTAQGDGTWLVDGGGEPVAPGWLWLDARTAALVSGFVGTETEKTIFETSGTGINACQQRFHLAWLLRNRPDVLERAESAMHCKDWLYFKLTGERATDPSEGIFTFGNYRTRAYDDDLIEALGLSSVRRLLPDIVDGCTEHHSLMEQAASATGFAEGTPVVLGYLDTVCTGLGGGIIPESGHSVGCTVVGSTSMHMRVIGDPRAVRLNSERTGYTMSFPLPGEVAQMQSNMSGTLNLDWLVDLAREAAALAGRPMERRDVLEALGNDIIHAPAGAAIYHPFINRAGERGPFFDPNARAGFIGLDQSAGLAAMMRSVFEGLALAGRDAYEAMGPLPEEIRLVGGAARSEAFRSIFASVLGAPIRTVERSEPGAAGAAMIAATCLGLYPTTREAAADWVTPRLSAPIAAEKGAREFYDRLFEVYRETRERLRPAWSALAAIRSGADHARG